MCLYIYFCLFILFASCVRCKGMKEIPRKEKNEAPTGMQSEQTPASPGNAVFTQPACAHCLYKLYLVYALVTICQPAPISEAQSRVKDSLPPERLTLTSGFLVGYKNSLQNTCNLYAI